MFKSIRKQEQTRASGGFTLIEIALAVLILGFGVVTLIGLSRIDTAAKKERITRERAAFIEKALLSYVRQHGDLPCPAKRNLPLHDSTVDWMQEFGRQWSTDPMVGEFSCYAWFNDVRPEYVVTPGAPNNATIGTIPTRSLNISDEYMFDGWGNRFTYAVTGRNTAEGDTGWFGHIDFDESVGTIRMVDETGAPLTIPPTATNYVIVSHGADGRGAFRRNGTRINCGPSGPGTPIDRKNCDNDATFVEAPRNVRAAGSATWFDDIVTYGTFIPGLAGNYCNSHLMFDAPDHPLADANGCVSNKMALARWDYIKMDCNPANTGPSAVPGAEPLASRNCATAKFTIATANFVSPDLSDGIELYNSGTLTAAVDGFLRVRAVIPAVYTNAAGGVGTTNWEHSIIGSIFVNGVRVGSGLVINPEPTTFNYGGRTGIVTAIDRITAGEDYTISVRIASLKGGGMGIGDAWAGTIKHSEYYAEGTVEIIEQIR